MLAKRALNVSQLNGLKSMLNMELVGQGVAFETPDRFEAVDGFLSMQAPKHQWPT